ncbi:MAG: efflux RND transporter periplasmic adaptor subunit [bacterium]|nr:efflux RND transporter periplasmic adaptor subunit [bacterium]
MKAKDPRIFMIGTMLVLGLALGGCASGEEQVEEAHEIPHNVRVLELGASTLSEYFEIAGPVTPVRAADLSAEESGPVVALGVAKGGAVAAGDVIVEQERDILAAELAAARANLETQAYNVDKVRQLHEAGKVSRMELLNADSAHAQAKSLAEVSAVRYARAAISAPFAGVVVDRYVELGELVPPGQRVARVIDPYTLKIEAFLTDSQVGWVSRGDAARVALGEPGLVADGTVTFISPEASRTTGKFAVEIEIPNNELRFRSGVIGRARLPKHDTAGAVSVPRDAVLDGRAGPMAYVVDGERAYQRQLTLGSFQGLMVIVESGLVPGERLVVRGQRDLRDGSLVQVTETTTDADGSLPGDPDAATAAGAGTRVGTGAIEGEAGR